MAPIKTRTSLQSLFDSGGMLGRGAWAFLRRAKTCAIRQRRMDDGFAFRRDFGAKWLARPKATRCPCCLGGPSLALKPVSARSDLTPIGGRSDWASVNSLGSSNPSSPDEPWLKPRTALLSRSVLAAPLEKPLDRREDDACLGGGQRRSDRATPPRGRGYVGGGARVGWRYLRRSRFTRPCRSRDRRQTS